MRAKQIKDEFKDEVRAFAKSLYMLAKPDGSHKYSIPSINDRVWDKFGKVLKTKFNPETIRLWSKRKDFSGHTWRSEYQAQVAIGVFGGDSKVTGDVFDDEIAKNTRESYELNSKSNRAAIKFLQVWQQTCMRTLKIIAENTCGGDVAKILKEDFDSYFDRDDRKLMFEIKKDTDAILEKLINNSAVKNVEDDSNVKIEIEIVHPNE